MGLGDAKINALKILMFAVKMYITLQRRSI